MLLRICYMSTAVVVVKNTHTHNEMRCFHELATPALDWENPVVSQQVTGAVEIWSKL